MPDLESMPAARQTVSMKARLAAAGLTHAGRPSGPSPDSTKDLPASARVTAARSRARERVDRQRQLLRPLGVALIAIVVTASLNSHPAPGLSGARLGVSLALAGFAAAVAVTAAAIWARRGYPYQVVLIGFMGGCGVALAALQPHGPAEIAASVAVWIAAVRLPLRPTIAATVLITGALATGDRADRAARGAVRARRDAVVPATGGDWPIHPAWAGEPGPHRTAHGPVAGRPRG
jgi:hypothetical protein